MNSFTKPAKIISILFIITMIAGMLDAYFIVPITKGFNSFKINFEIN